MNKKATQKLNISKESKLTTENSPKAIFWNYTIPPKTTNFYLLVSIFGILFVWLGLNYLNSYVLTIIVIFGLILVIGKSLIREELNFFFTDEHLALENQEIDWSNIKYAVFLPYHNDYLIALQPETFPYVRMYVPAPKAQIQEILEFISRHTEIKDFKTESLADRLIRFLIF